MEKLQITVRMQSFSNNYLGENMSDFGYSMMMTMLSLTIIIVLALAIF